MMEDYGEGMCPPDVPEADCVAVTQEERQRILDDLQYMVIWDEPDCANIGYTIQDFVQNGDLRKFPTYSNFWGWWQAANYAFPGQPEQISFESSTLQGWSSQRIRTAIHEGTHRLYQQGPQVESAAQGFAEFCINW